MIIDDSVRIKHATPSGGRMLGPVERQRCTKHPRRWIMFRWIWDKGGDISASEPEIVRGCGSCADESDDE